MTKEQEERMHELLWKFAYAIRAGDTCLVNSDTVNEARALLHEVEQEDW